MVLEVLGGKMKIKTDKDRITCIFAELELGEIFRIEYGTYVWMKITPIKNSDRTMTLWNCVNLKDGKVSYVSDNVNCQRLDHELVVHG